MKASIIKQGWMISGPSDRAAVFLALRCICLDSRAGRQKFKPGQPCPSLQTRQEHSTCAELEWGPRSREKGDEKDPRWGRGWENPRWMRAGPRSRYKGSIAPPSHALSKPRGTGFAIAAPRAEKRPQVLWYSQPNSVGWYFINIPKCQDRYYPAFSHLTELISSHSHRDLALLYLRWLIRV